MEIEGIKSSYQRKLRADWRRRNKGEESALAKYKIRFLHDVKNRDGIPEAVLASYDFYYDQVESQDWGSVRAYKIKVDRRNTYAICVTTDGDDGCLEVFDDQGAALCAGSTNSGDVSWDSTSAVRDRLLGR